VFEKKGLVLKLKSFTSELLENKKKLNDDQRKKKELHYF
jgi:hypothetical protein